VSEYTPTEIDKNTHTYWTCERDSARSSSSDTVLVRRTPASATDRTEFLQRRKYI